jgi:hypothetical protein
MVVGLQCSGAAPPTLTRIPLTRLQQPHDTDTQLAEEELREHTGGSGDITAPTARVAGGWDGVQLPSVNLTNFGEVQFFGNIAVGTPPQTLTVTFDTGSGHLLLVSDACTVTSPPRASSGRSREHSRATQPLHCQGGGGGGGYSQQRSSTARPSRAPFAPEWGTSGASGESVLDTVTLATDGWAADGVPISVATRESPGFARLRFQVCAPLHHHPPPDHLHRDTIAAARLLRRTVSRTLRLSVRPAPRAPSAATYNYRNHCVSCMLRLLCAYCVLRAPLRL